MENLWTLMIFENGQPQALVLQYKGRDNARRDLNLMKPATADKVTVVDDFGRELTIRPMNVQTTLLQDIDRGAEGNLAANVMNNVASSLAQVHTQEELEKHPEVRRAMSRAQLTQGVPGNGIFRG